MNCTNFDKTFLEKRDSLPDGSTLLLHACCAPCSTYCLTQLVEKFAITIYFSNDNITDFAEWEKRKVQLEKLVKIVNDGQFVVKSKYPVNLVVKEHAPSVFYTAAAGYEVEKEGGKRCEKCFAMRLSDAAQYAESHAFCCFATTLTVSPHKNAELINAIGLSLPCKTEYLPTDFKKRDGYLQSIRLCNKYGIYRQNYCGCEFSLLQNA